jgi:hypothetical protein
MVSVPLFRSHRMTSLNRREFLNTASVLTAGGVAASLTAHLYAGEDEKPKERPPVKLAIMGVNSRGKQLLPGFVEIPEQRHDSFSGQDRAGRRQADAAN